MNDIKKLLDGFKRFRISYFGSDKALYERLAEKQSPKVLVVGCCDSRVDPAILTDCCPGDLFVMRNIANLIPPYGSDFGDYGVGSALECAVRILKVEHVIVLGHSRCSGIGALMQPDGEKKAGEFIGRWVAIAQPAKDSVLRDLGHESHTLRCRACEQASILMSLKNLMSFPWVARAVSERTLTLHGWYFDLEKGELLGYQADTGEFEKLD